MTVPVAPSRALRVKQAAVRQRVAQLLLRSGEQGGQQVGPVLLFRAEPAWDGDPGFDVGGRPVRVVACVSPLAVLEQVTAHVAAADGAVLVVLTDREDSELGTGVLSRAYRHQVLTIEPWPLVAESFGAQRLDPRLTAERWAAEALLDAMPAGGWPRLSGTVLNRDAALRHLAARRLGVEERLGLDPDDLDAVALLRWSALPGAVEEFLALRSEERQGLEAWLVEQAGRTAEALFALVDAGRGQDAVALGLICEALWAPEAQGSSERAQGRVDLYFGGANLDDDTVRAFAGTAQRLVIDLLAAPDDGDLPPAGTHLAHDVLDRAEELLRQLAAEDAARHSDVLRSGFDHRIEAVATALKACLRDSHSPPPDEAVAELARTVASLAEHKLAGEQRRRIEQATMAQRLVQWLVHWRGMPEEAPLSVGDGIGRQLAEWGWVDLALGYVFTGEGIDEGLKAAYRELYRIASAHRRKLDAAFADRLARWTSAGTDPGEMLSVETVLPRVVAPLVTRGKRPALLLVLDGMSAAVAVQLAEELRRQRWEEYDPLGDPAAGNEAGAGDARRRAVVAALPTLTRVSRASLFAAELREDDQDGERRAFEGHRFWRGHAARLFHKDAVRGDPGDLLGEELTQALSDTGTLVAVVLNTIDDALDRGREGSGAGWEIADVGPLHELLNHARYHGRAVIITSDHGHVLDHGGRSLTASDAQSARHRSGRAAAAGGHARAGHLADGEVLLEGPRVVAKDSRVVALWDPRARYAQRRAGYHGGASLAEVTVPLLAFLPLGAAAPAGWRALADQQPPWWSTVPKAQVAEAVLPEARRQRRKASEAEGQTALDMPATAATAARLARTRGGLVDALLASEMFQAQHGLTPRKLPATKVAAAIAALLDANGVLPMAVLAERAGEQPARAGGFVTTLQRIFNVDNYPVLSVVDDTGTVRLDERLLRVQFDLKEG